MVRRERGPGKEQRMSKSWNFIDSDAHVIEPRDIFERYLEPKYRAQMPVAWADYQGEPLAFGFEIRVPRPSGGEYVIPFGNDPLTGRNRIDTHSRLAAFDGGARVDVGPCLAVVSDSSVEERLGTDMWEGTAGTPGHRARGTPVQRL
jgi:hypothetical protein